MLRLPILSSMVLVALATTASSSWTRDVKIQQGVNPDNQLSLSPWHNSSLSLSTTDINGPEPLAIDARIAVAAFKAIGKIDAAACASASVVACVSVGLAACFVAGLAFWRSRRDLDHLGDIQIDYLPEFAPTDSCHGHCHRQALRASIPRDGTLTHIGYVTVNGTRHESHMAHGGALGNLTQLRSIQATGGLAKRYNEGQDEDYGGVVSDYYYNDINRNDFNEFEAGGQVQELEWADKGAQMTANVLEQYNSLAGCTSWYDGNTDGMHGVSCVGWNDHGFVWGSGGAPSIWDAYSECGYTDGA